MYLNRQQCCCVRLNCGHVQYQCFNFDEWIYFIDLRVNKVVLSVSCASSNSEWTGFISRLRWGSRVCATVRHWPFVVVAAVHHPHDDAGHHGDNDEQEQGGAYYSDDHGRVAGRQRFWMKHTTGTKHKGFQAHCRPVAYFPTFILAAFGPSSHMLDIRSKQLPVEHQRQNPTKWGEIRKLSEEKEINFII